MSEAPRVCDYEGSDYEALWKDGRRRHDDLVEPPLIASLLPETGDWFVDLGCAHGRLAGIYLPRFSHCVMLDYSPTHLAAARERWAGRENLWFVAADVYRLPLRAGQFDAATLIRVMHHLEEPARALAGVARMLAPGGRLVTNYRNRRDLRNVVRWALRLPHRSPFRVAHDDPTGRDELQAFTHPRFFEDAMASAGFRVRRRRGSSFFGGRLARFPGAATLEKLGAPLLARPALAPLIFVEGERRGGRPAAPATRLAEVLACPDCHGDLEEPGAGDDAYRCTACARSFPVLDGIPDFR